MLELRRLTFLKPFIPRRVQIYIRRALVNWKLPANRQVWPIDPGAAVPPENWQGWPNGKQFALVLTHDVDTSRGISNCLDLAKKEELLGFRSSFNFVAEDYQIPNGLLDDLSSRGFEIGQHGIHHTDPFRTKEYFGEQAAKINQYLKKWNAVGFRGPSMYRNLDWIRDLNIVYDSSTFDTDPFEPQPQGMSSIFPFWVAGNSSNGGYVELPYTLPQDFLSFILLKQENTDLWKKKLDWIAKHGGMALLISHPDYMDFGHSPPGNQSYPAQRYIEFLEYVRTQYDGQYWHVLPREVAGFWKRHYAYETVRIKPKRKVCMLAYSFYDTDARVRRYAEALARRGDHVDVIALKQPGQREREVLHGVNVHRVQERLLDEKGKLDYASKLLKFLLVSFKVLTRNHLKFAYDMIHVHSVPDFEVFAALLPRITGAKVILDIHDPVPDFFAAKFGADKNNRYVKLLTFIERISTKFSDHVITVTDYWRQVIAERSRLNDGKISVILNLPDVRIFNYSNHQREQKQGDNFTLLYPGTLNRHCGLDIAIKAVELVKDEIPSIKFQIYGSGSELDNLKALVSEHGLENFVTFNGATPLETIPGLMRNADAGIALLAGHGEYSQQALNVKLFEFLSMGLPAVATRTKSIQYYLKEGTVLLSEPNDPGDVARCIRELNRNPEKREALKERGLNFIEKNNSETEMKKYLNILDNLV